MRNNIRKILKENKDFSKKVYVIMSDDETMMLLKTFLSGDSYRFIPISEIDDENFWKFKFEDNHLSDAEAVLGYVQKKFRSLKPKIVEYYVGYFRAGKDMSNAFDQLTV